MRNPLAARSTLDMSERRRVDTAEQASYWREAAARERSARDADAARYDALLAKYHELAIRLTTPPPAPTQAPVTTAASVLGEKSRNALSVMGQGQARSTRDAMLTEALRLHAAGGTDENIAKAIYDGERIQ